MPSLQTIRCNFLEFIFMGFKINDFSNLFEMKLLLFVFSPLISNSQIIYKGTVINSTTRKPVAYATVGLLKENAGINANEDGVFSLSLGKYVTDTLIISCAGYETKKFPIDNLPPDYRFEIPAKQIVLSNLVVRSNYKHSSILNDYENCGLNSYTSTGSVTQIAQHLQSPVANAMLSEIYICKRSDNSLFRIRVYDMDSASGKPGHDLADTIIEVNSGKRHVQVNLEKYNIVIPGKDFFVGIEWIYVPINKFRTKIKGQKNYLIQYSPLIFFKNKRIENENRIEAWQLDYRRKWLRTSNDWFFLISAKVKY